MHAKVGQVGGHEGVGTFAKLGPSCEHVDGGKSMGFQIIRLDVGGKEEFVKSCAAEVFIDV